MYRFFLKIFLLQYCIKVSECYLTIESMTFTGNKDAKANTTIKSKLNNQFLDMDAFFAYDIDHKFDMQNIWFLFVKNKWVQVIETKPEDSCTFMNHYVGPIWPYFLRKSGIKTHSCFFAKGTYRIRDFSLNFNAYAITMLPKGLIKLLLKVIRKENQELIMISETLMSNK